jgi:hypothetical protein
VVALEEEFARDRILARLAPFFIGGVEGELPSGDEPLPFDEPVPARTPRSPRRSTIPPAPTLNAVDTCEPEKLPALIAAAAARLLTLPSTNGAAATTITSPTAPSEQHPLTQAETAEAYDMPLRLVRRLTRTRAVPSYLQGRNRMIQPADMDAYLRRCRERRVRVGTTLDA